MVGNLRKWKQCATLILAAKQVFGPSEAVNYKILTMKRSSKSSFMPDTHVFPGGSLDEADCSTNWLTLYKKFGINDHHFNIFRNVQNIAPIFKNEKNDTIPKFISLRICAIREAFEECGVLLCRSSKQQNNGDVSTWSSYFGGVKIKDWQHQVHDNPVKFLEFCEKFEIYPDIWALHEWSNWLTPAGLNRKFDTIFFLAYLQNIIPTFAEQTEVQHIQWDSPSTLLQENVLNNIFLPPPQFYELNRLMNFSTIEELSKYSQKRALNGTEPFLPYRLATDKIQMTILPGDDLYPGIEEAQEGNDDILDEIPSKNKMHRVYHSDSLKNTIIMKNYQHKIEHVYPVTIQETQSKL